MTAKIDLTALRAAVHAVNPFATVTPWASSDHMIRIRRFSEIAAAAIDVGLHRRSPSVECRFVRTRPDRALLRAVLDELDRQEAERGRRGAD